MGYIGGVPEWRDGNSAYQNDVVSNIFKQQELTTRVMTSGIQTLTQAEDSQLRSLGRKHVVDYAVDLLIFLRNNGKMEDGNIRRVLSYFDDAEVELIKNNYMRRLAPKSMAPVSSEMASSSSSDEEVSPLQKVEDAVVATKNFLFSIFFTKKKTPPTEEKK